MFFKASLIAVYCAITRVEQETTAHFWGSKHGGAVAPPWQTLILALEWKPGKVLLIHFAYTLIAYIIVGTSGLYILRVGKFNLLNSFHSFSFSNHALFFSPCNHFYTDLILSWKSHFFNVFKNHVKNIFPFCEYALCPQRACACLPVTCGISLPAAFWKIESPWSPWRFSLSSIYPCCLVWGSMWIYVCVLVLNISPIFIFMFSW